MSKGRYSKVSRRIWVDEKFRRLTQPKACGATLFLRLLTGPELTNVPGLFPAWEAGLSQSLGWELKAFREAFAEAFQEGLAEADWDVGLVWIRKAIEHNEPESPNVVVAWENTLADLPDCALKRKAFAHLKAWAKAKGEAWAKAWAKACPNQEQEQEQEQEQIYLRTDSPKPAQETRTKTTRTRQAPRVLTEPPDALEPTPATLAVASKTGRDWRFDWERCRDWARGKGERRADWQATLRNWMTSPINNSSNGNGAKPIEKWGPGCGNGPQPNNPDNPYIPKEFTL